MTKKDKIKLLKEKGYVCLFGSHSKVVAIQKPVKAYFNDEQLNELANEINYQEWNEIK